MRIRHDLGQLVLTTPSLFGRLARTHGVGHEMRGVHWHRRWRRRRCRLLLGLGHWPHVHGDGPVGLDHCLPDLRQDDFAVRPDKIVVALVDVRADNVDVEESLLDELFHTLEPSVMAREML